MFNFLYGVNLTGLLHISNESITPSQFDRNFEKQKFETTQDKIQGAIFCYQNSVKCSNQLLAVHIVEKHFEPLFKSLSVKKFQYTMGETYLEAENLIEFSLIRNNVASLKFLIENNFFFEQHFYENENTCLHLALTTYLHDGKCAEYLIKSLVHVSTPNKDQVYPIHIVAENPNLISHLELLLQNVKVNVSDNKKNKPIHLAAISANFHALQLLIEAKADIYSPNIDGDVPLSCAVKSKSLQCAKLLLQAGATPREKVADGKTILSLAIELGDRKMTELLTSQKSVDFSDAIKLALDFHMISVVSEFFKRGNKLPTEISPDIVAVTAVINNDMELLTYAIDKLGASMYATDNMSKQSLMEISGQKGFDNLVTFLRKRGVPFSKWVVHDSCTSGSLENIEESLKGKSQEEILEIISMKKENGDFPLLLAVVHQRDLLVDWLLDRHVDITMANSVTGETVLHAAGEIWMKFRFYFVVKREHLGILKKIFRYLQSTDPKEVEMAKALPNISDFEGRYPIHLVYHNLQITEFLVEKGADTSVIYDDNSILFHYLRAKEIETFIKLCKSGKDMEALSQGKTLFIEAFEMKPRSKEVFITILSNGAQVTSPQIYPFTDWIIYNNHVKLLKIWIENGLDIDRRFDDNRTLLGKAVQMSKVEIVRALLSMGATISHLSYENNSLLHWAINYKHNDIVRFLVKCGDNIHRIGLNSCLITFIENSGFTPLGEACNSLNTEMIKFLIERGANVALINANTQENLLHWITKPWVAPPGFDREAFEKEAVTKYPHLINIGDYYGITPLTYAILNLSASNNIKLIELFISKGGDLNYQDYQWNTPFHSICNYLNENSILRTKLLKLALASGGTPFIANLAGVEASKFLIDSGLNVKFGKLKKKDPKFQEFINYQFKYDPIYSDVSLFVDGNIFLAHKIFMSRSPVLKKLFDENPSQSNFAVNVPYPVFLYVMEFLYTDFVRTIPPQSHPELYVAITKAAEYLELPRLKNIVNKGVVGSSTLLSHLKSCLDSGEYSDIVFRLEGKSIKAHRFIVSSRCVYYKAMFSSGMKETHNDEVFLDDISFPVFKSLLEFLYTDRFAFDPETIWDLFEVSDIFELPVLKIKSESELIWSIDAENVLHLFQASNIYSAAELKMRCLEFIAHQLIGITSSPFMDSVFPILTRNEEDTLGKFMPPESYSHYKKMKSIYEANKK